MARFGSKWYRFCDWLETKWERLWGIDVPPSCPIGEWEVWEEKTKKAKPIGYFMARTLPNTLSYWHYRTIEKPWQWLKDHLYYRRNVIKVETLPCHWWDKCWGMIHYNFHLLVDFVEKEDGINQWDHGENNHVRDSIEEMKFLYNWYKNVRPARKYKEEFPELKYWRMLFREETKDDPEVKEWNRIADQRTEEERVWEEEDEEMMIRLIKIRHILWT